jgi:hypothetical protein
LLERNFPLPPQEKRIMLGRHEMDIATSSGTLSIRSFGEANRDALSGWKLTDRSCFVSMPLRWVFIEHAI